MPAVFFLVKNLLFPFKTPDQLMSKSYQFASSTIPGWNDCPAINPTPASGKRITSKSRRINHVCHLDALNSDNKQVEPKSYGSVPPLPPNSQQTTTKN